MNNLKRYFAITVLAVAMICIIAGIAYAKSPCKKGYNPWWHETGNGTIKCQCYKKDKPPKNPEWHKGCPVDNKADTPVSTRDTDNDVPSPNDTPVSGNVVGSKFAKITRTDPKTYYITQDGTIKIWWIGELESVLICDHDKNCYPPFEPPANGVAVNNREKRGTLFLGRSLEPGTYFLYGLNAENRTGNETNVRLQVEK